MGALEFAGEEFQANASGFELFGQGCEFDSAAESFVLVHDQGDRGARDADLPRQGDGAVEFSRQQKQTAPSSPELAHTWSWTT